MGAGSILFIDKGAVQTGVVVGRNMAINNGKQTNRQLGIGLNILIDNGRHQENEGIGHDAMMDVDIDQWCDRTTRRVAATNPKQGAGRDFMTD
eukprot:g25543.t1